MDYSLLIAYLRQKQYITDLEKDILDTWNELQKNPFVAIAALPATETRPFEQATDSDIRYNLEKQLAALAAKEGWQKYGQ